MKTAILIIAFIAAPLLAFAGAIGEGSVRAEDFNLLPKVVQQLSVHPFDGLRPQVKQYEGQTYTYYIQSIHFLGRVLTPSGYRNFFWVGYTRSEPYNSRRNTPPARGTAYYLCVMDGGEIEFFGRTDSGPARIDRGILKSEDNSMDLTSEKGWRFFKEVRPIN